MSMPPSAQQVQKLIRVSYQKEATITQLRKQLKDLHNHKETEDSSLAEDQDELRESFTELKRAN